MARKWIIDDPDNAETTISGLKQPEPGFFTIEDARLIVAAEDLLAVCRLALNELEAITEILHFAGSEQLKAQLRAAIAKAEGKNDNPT